MKSEEPKGGYEASAMQAGDGAVTRRELLGTVGKLAPAGAAISLAKPLIGTAWGADRCGPPAGPVAAG